MPKYDVAVIGLGVVGSAITAGLSKRGLRVRGLDQHAVVSHQRASWGQSRMVRSLVEDKRYQVLLSRAQELWATLAYEQKTEIFLPTGCTIVGSRSSTFLRSAVAAQHQILSAAPLRPQELKKHFSGIQILGAYDMVEDQDAGVLLTEPCLEALRSVAQKHGAVLHFEHPIEAKDLNEDGAQKVADECDAEIVVLATGAWAPQWKSPQTKQLRVERTYGAWYRPYQRSAAAEQRPLLIVDTSDAPIAVFPQIDGEVKVVLHHSGDLVSPASCKWTVSPNEIAALNTRLHTLFPNQYEEMPRRTAVGLYTNAPGGDFMVDWAVPEKILLASACSGKGFKFAPAVGEYVADLIQRRHSKFPASLFS